MPTNSRHKIATYISPQLEQLKRLSLPVSLARAIMMLCNTQLSLEMLDIRPFRYYWVSIR